MGNEAVEINPPSGLDLHITEHGSNWYWAAFALMALLTLVHLGGAYKLRPANERVFFFNSALSLFFMTITYFTLASNLGWVGIKAQFHHADSDYATTYHVRQIFYARYIGWFLAFPPLMGNLAILSAVAWPTALFSVLCQEIFCGVLVDWIVDPLELQVGYYVFALVAMFVVAFNFIFGYRKSALSLDGRVFTGFQSITYGVVFLIMLYPICWGLSEGGNVIQPDSEAAFYGVLDVLLFGILNTAFQWFVKDLNFTTHGLYFGGNKGLMQHGDHEKTSHSFDHANAHDGGVVEPAPVAAAPAAHEAPTTVHHV